MAYMHYYFLLKKYEKLLHFSHIFQQKYMWIRYFIIYKVMKYRELLMK